MDMKCFMSKLRNQIGFHRNARETDPSDEEVDVMDGDYVILGERPSESERVSADGLPTYTCATNEQYQGQPPSPSHPTATTLDFPRPVSPRCNDLTTAVSDVPFQFHPRLSVQQQLHNMFNDLDLHTHHFDWNKYSHDFSHEKLCLRDLNHEDGS